MKIKRIIDLQKLLEDKSYFLLGPRQTGKSTLIRESLPHCRNYNLLQSDVFQKLSLRPSLLREEILPSDKIIVVDEIQKIPALLDEIQWLIEEKGLRFLLTGSSARKLKRSGANLLGGRARSRFFHPFIYAELLEHFSLQRAFYSGLLPSIYFSNAVDEDLDSYTGLYLQQEIVAEGLARNLQSFSRTLEIAALSHAQQINFNSLASDAQVSRSTLQNYFEILEETLIINRLPVWQEGQKRKAVSTAKFYFFDFGIVRRLQKIESIPEKSVVHGLAFESYLFHEIKTYCDYYAIKDLHYWRTQNKDEVDFIMDNHVAIEVKATSLATEKHAKGLKRLKEEKLLKRYILVTMDQNYRRLQQDEEIEIYPWNQFVIALWQHQFSKRTP